MLYQFGQLQYTIGNYGAAADLLYHFRILVFFRLGMWLIVVYGRDDEYSRCVGEVRC